MNVPKDLAGVIAKESNFSLQKNIMHPGQLL